MRDVADLVLVGANHRTAAVDVRGLLARQAADALPALWSKNGAASIAEVLLVSTCHRVEVLVVARDPGLAERQLRTVMNGAGVYMHRGLDAVAHLAGVASGLDSLIVGEAEISGQIRRALAAGRASGAVGPYLDRVVAGALNAGGRARSETRIGTGALSAAAASVSLLERSWPSLAGRSLLVVGGGEAGRQALARLAKRGAGRLIVASRSARHAADAAARAGAEAIALDRVPAVLPQVDGAIVATQSAGFVIVPAMLAPVRELEIVDLSVPRGVDPAVAELPGIRLRTVDDLGQVARESVKRRLREIPRVQRIVAEEAARTYRQFVTRRDRLRPAVA
jgi:glutamyl-tRNA reductase